MEAVLPLPTLTEAPHECKTLHEASNTLFLGCTAVHAVDVARMALLSTTAIDFGNPPMIDGGSYSGGGVVAA